MINKKFSLYYICAGITAVILIIIGILLLTQNVTGKEKEEIKQTAVILAQKNFDAVTFFEIAPLYTEEGYKKEDYPAGVTPCSHEIFSDYASFEGFIRTTYMSETAELLLNSTYNGEQKYINYNGKLCKSAFKVNDNYPLDFTKSKLKVENIKKSRADVVLTVEKKDGSGTENLILTINKIDGKWLLENMVY